MSIIREPTITITNTCPACNETNIGHYGTVDTPPLSVQMSDNHLGISRHWLSQRHHCPKCNEIFDVIVTNEIGDNTA